MPKYKKAGKHITEDFVSSLFRAIGRGLSPVILKTLSKKDPKFGELVKNLEKSREKVNSYVKQRTGKSSLSKADIKAIKKGELPSWQKKIS